MAHKGALTVVEDLDILQDVRTYISVPHSCAHYQHPSAKQDTYQVDTSNVLFIVSGAFVGLEDVIRRRVARGVWNAVTLCLFTHRPLVNRIHRKLSRIYCRRQHCLAIL